MNAKSTLLTPVEKAGITAKWAMTMTKWLIRHSSKQGVKWRLVDFNGKQAEPVGIVDLIAVRKDFRLPENGGHRGDQLEIILIQVKGSASFPMGDDIDRLMKVKEYHRAKKFVLAEWKKLTKLCLYEWAPADAQWDPVSRTWNPENAKWTEVTANEIFGKHPEITKTLIKVATEIRSSEIPLAADQKAVPAKKTNAKAAVQPANGKVPSSAVLTRGQKAARTRQANIAAAARLAKKKPAPTTSLNGNQKAATTKKANGHSAPLKALAAVSSKSNGISGLNSSNSKTLHRTTSKATQ